MSDTKLMIDCEGLVKIYKTDDLEVVALQGLNLKVSEGGVDGHYRQQRQREVNAAQYIGRS